MKITPNLAFESNAREAFEVYAGILGADRLVLIPFSDVPEAPVGPEWKDKIAHAWLEVGNQAIMGSDSPPSICADGVTASGSVCLHLDGIDDARRIFDALAEGGSVQMPFAATSWSPGFGAVRDRFGKDWMINTNQETGQ